jgi:hypothetical protein
MGNVSSVYTVLTLYSLVMRPLARLSGKLENIIKIIFEFKSGLCKHSVVSWIIKIFQKKPVVSFFRGRRFVWCKLR